MLLADSLDYAASFRYPHRLLRQLQHFIVLMSKPFDQHPYGRRCPIVSEIFIAHLKFNPGRDSQLMGRPLIWIGIVTLLLGMSGCRLWLPEHPVANAVIHGSDNLASRASFLKWNMRTKCAQADRLTRCSRALALASRSGFELDNLMASQPAPSVEILDGRWHGINKGAGAAAIGLTQDIKVFSVNGRCLTGHNVAVYQVGLDDLACRGFEPKINPLTGCEKTMGNFVIQPACTSCQPLKLDYTQADNSPLDPSRWLVDELVMIDYDMLLGKAYTKMGQHLMPVAFFVLTSGRIVRVRPVRTHRGR